MALPSFPLHLSYPADEACGGRVQDAGGYDLAEEDVAAINAIGAKMQRLRAVVEDTKLSPTAALDTIRAILEEE